MLKIRRFRLYIFITLLLIALLAVGLFFFRQKPGGQPQGWGQRPGGPEDFGGPPQSNSRPRWQGPIPTPPQNEITYYKGLWAGNWFYPEERSGSKPEPEKHQSWGVNIVNIQPGFEINAKGETRYPLDYPSYEDLDAWFGELATLFYKYNIHLGMTVMIHYKEEFIQGNDWGGETAYVPKEKIQKAGYIKNYDKIVVDMAKIAEKYHFYFFSPMGEPENVFLDAKLASDWSQQILPKIKKYYHGKIYYKGDLHQGQGDSMDFKGYDILGMVPSPTDPKASKEELRKVFNDNMDRALGWAKRDGVQAVVISEHGYLGEGKMASVENIGLVLEEGSKKLNGVFLTEPLPQVLKTSQGNQIVAEIKKWFLNH